MLKCSVFMEEKLYFCLLIELFGHVCTTNNKRLIKTVVFVVMEGPNQAWEWEWLDEVKHNGLHNVALEQSGIENYGRQLTAARSGLPEPVCYVHRLTKLSELCITYIVLSDVNCLSVVQTGMEFFYYSRGVGQDGERVVLGMETCSCTVIIVVMSLRVSDGASAGRAP